MNDWGLYGGVCCWIASVSSISCCLPFRTASWSFSFLAISMSTTSSCSGCFEFLAWRIPLFYGPFPHSMACASWLWCSALSLRMSGTGSTVSIISPVCSTTGISPVLVAALGRKRTSSAVLFLHVFVSRFQPLGAGSKLTVGLSLSMRLMFRSLLLVVRSCTWYHWLTNWLRYDGLYYSRLFWVISML